VITYFTHDEVNAALARRMARKMSLELTVVTVKDIDQAGASDLLLFDLDHLPIEFKEELFQHVQRSDLGARIAVHSYHLSASEVRCLRKAGGLAARRLSAALLAPRLVA
jgi:hypothetical protein